MSDNLVISIDAMGGDNSPRVVIEGVNIAARKNPDVRFLLFGDEAKIAPLLKQYPRLAKVQNLSYGRMGKKRRQAFPGYPQPQHQHVYGN